MSDELIQIRDEISQLNNDSADIVFLEALVNNLIYCLKKLEEQAEAGEEMPVAMAIKIVATDILATKNRELAKAKLASAKSSAAFPDMFRQVKLLIVNDINQIIEEV